MKAITAWLLSSGKGGGGTTPSSYNDLDDLPVINGKEVIGEMDSDYLDLVGENDELTEEQMNDLLQQIDDINSGS